MIEDGPDEASDNLVLELVKLGEILPASTVRDRLDSATDDLIRRALGDSRVVAACIVV